MKQIVISKYGAPEVLQVRDAETPTPKSGEILINMGFGMGFLLLINCIDDCQIIIR